MVYIFDFDGTLVDSMSVWAGAHIKLMKKHNIDYPENLIEIITPMGGEAAAKYCISIGLDMTVEEMHEYYHNAVGSEYENTIPAKKNVIETLKKLKEQGHNLNVLTASPHPHLDPCLKRLGVIDLFDNLWTVEDIGPKNEVETYRIVAEKLGKELSDCYFADDNFVAVSTAKKAGMKTIGVYDESSAEFVDQIKEVVDKYVYDFSELLD